MPHHQLESSEQINQDDLNEKIKKDKERFEKLVTTKNKIHTVKADLSQLIQAMHRNPSLFSQAARFWYKVPLWQKISAGVALIVPFLTIGVMAHLLVFITLGIVTGIIYTASSFLLDNHQRYDALNREQLNKGISSLVELLDTVITTLELVREQLAMEIEAFERENERLAKNNFQFSKQINSLKSQISELADTEKKLRATQIELELTAKTLQGSIEEQSQVLEKTQKELEQVAQEYKDNQKKLSDKMTELDEVKEHMKQEVDQAQSITLVLRSSVETLSQLVIADEEQRTSFQLRLNDFLNNKEKSFDLVAERICEAESKLTLVTKQLEESNQRYRELLDRQEQQIIRLEQIDVDYSDEIDVEYSDELEESFEGVSKPSINGFYAVKKERPLGAVPTQGAAIGVV